MVDALILDDVDECAGKERSQEELFHIFNSLVYNGRQIVFASAHAPKAIEGLEERLRSRFEGGLVVEIQPPDHALREKLYARYLAGAGERARSAARRLSRLALGGERGRDDGDRRPAAEGGGGGGRAAQRVVRAQGARGRRHGARALEARPTGAMPIAFFLDEEKILWDWPDVTGRAIEEFR